MSECFCGGELVEDQESYSFAPIFFCKKCLHHYTVVEGKIITSHPGET